MFHFKQFSIDQNGCAMKINTDGVLLGALARFDNPQNILDIGTGTGVIALMLAQRFDTAQIDAIEIDEIAVQTAEKNFKNSPFSHQLAPFSCNFSQFFNENESKKYDLIVSNPPFYLNSLTSPQVKKSTAKHADADFFDILINDVAKHLTESGLCWLVLPLQTATLVKELANRYKLYLQKVISVRSFIDSAPHREIVVFGHKEGSTELSNLTIYKAVNKYFEEYEDLLRPYFIVF